jgi:hypothetical protein
MITMRTNIVGPPCSATSKSPSIAACHGSTSCSALGSLVMYCPASCSLASWRPRGRGIGSSKRRDQDTEYFDPDYLRLAEISVAQLILQSCDWRRSAAIHTVKPIKTTAVATSLARMLSFTNAAPLVTDIGLIQPTGANGSTFTRGGELFFTTGASARADGWNKPAGKESIDSFRDAPPMTPGGKPAQGWRPRHTPLGPLL